MGLRGEAAIVGYVELPPERMNKASLAPFAIEQWAELSAAALEDAGLPVMSSTASWRHTWRSRRSSYRPRSPNTSEWGRDSPSTWTSGAPARRPWSGGRPRRSNSASATRSCVRCPPIHHPVIGEEAPASGRRRRSPRPRPGQRPEPGQRLVRADELGDAGRRRPEHAVAQGSDAGETADPNRGDPREGVGHGATERLGAVGDLPEAEVRREDAGSRAGDHHAADARLDREPPTERVEVAEHGRVEQVAGRVGEADDEHPGRRAVVASHDLGVHLAAHGEQVGPDPVAGRFGGHPPIMAATDRGDGERPRRGRAPAPGAEGQSPVAPSMRSRSRSAWPLCRAYSSIMWR